MITKGQQIVKVMVANQVPKMLAPKYVEKQATSAVSETNKQERVKKLQEQLDLSGTQSLTMGQRSKIHKVLADFHDVFALSLMELGCKSLVKHSIKIVDPKPFVRSHLVSFRQTSSQAT